LGIRYTW